MKKNLILFGLIFMLSLNLISSLTQQEIENFYGIHKADVLKTSEKSIEIKLLTDGISYKEKHTILFPNNEKGYVLFVLPQEIHLNNIRKINLYDLKNNDQSFIKYENITNLDNCSNFFMREEVNNTLTILACPDIKNQEIEIEIDILLFSQNIPFSCSSFDYYLNFQEIVVGVKEYISEDFKLYFRIDAEESILVSYPPKTNCEEKGMVKSNLLNGLECQGTFNPNNLDKEFLVLNNIALWGENKEKIEKEIEKDTLIKGIFIGAILGLIIAIITSIFQEPLKELGNKIFKRKQKKRKIKT